uniref:Envelope polyprotein n=1 Tax=Nomascus gabriellae TaxID=61852 RepID=Q304Z2_NOMGA|nr:envelope polyprotein [Nomascus gabriellae]
MDPSHRSPESTAPSRVMGHSPRGKSYPTKAKESLILFHLFCYSFFFPCSLASHLIINVTRSDSPQTITFDACLVIPCGDLQSQRQLAAADKYLCPSKADASNLRRFPFCHSWEYVVWTTQHQDWVPSKDFPLAVLKPYIHFTKGSAPPNCRYNQCNPVQISITISTLRDSSPTLNRFYGMGADVRGKDPIGFFRLHLITSPPLISPRLSSSTPADQTTVSSPDDKNKVAIVEIKNLKQTLTIERGYKEANAWMEWIEYSVRSLNKSDCYACAQGRPEAQVVPFPLGWSSAQPGMGCMVALFQHPTAWDSEFCRILSMRFPEIQQLEGEPQRAFQPPSPDAKFTSCLSRRGKNLQFLGDLQGCSEIKSFQELTNKSALVHARADVWWYCGRHLLDTLPHNWSGTCALIQLAIPFTLAFQQPKKEKLQHRKTRGAPEGSFDSSIYIDAIGVPQGVPDRFKARNPIAAGFESLFPTVAVNKNVGWINYIYYNQQRFINYTRDAIRGIAEQLGPTSQMAWENRMALDMILAEKGGVCVMIGTQCCTYIPNNTAPDGTITKALRGLTSLSDELATNSGISDPFTGWLGKWFGKWKGLMASIVTSLAIAIAVLILVGCCIMPCIRGLVQRLIETAIHKNFPSSSQSYSNKFFPLNDHQIQIMLDRFKENV